KIRAPSAIIETIVRLCDDHYIVMEKIHILRQQKRKEQPAKRDWRDEHRRKRYPNHLTLREDVLIDIGGTHLAHRAHITGRLFFLYNDKPFLLKDMFQSEGRITGKVVRDLVLIRNERYR